MTLATCRASLYASHKIEIKSIQKLFRIIKIRISHSYTPQLKISAFMHTNSNGVVDRTEDRETFGEAEGPPAKDHVSVL